MFEKGWYLPNRIRIFYVHDTQEVSIITERAQQAAVVQQWCSLIK